MSASGSKSIVQPYAQAVFNAANARGELALVLDEAKELLALLEKRPEFGLFLESPQISRERKHALADSAVKGKLTPILENLVRMMIDRERAVHLGAILREFEAVAERAQGILPAEVETARALGEDERTRLAAALEKYAKCKLRIDYKVKPALLGGVVFRFKDVLVDGSVRHGLDEIRRRFQSREGISV